MGAQRGQDDPWEETLVAEVAAQRRAVLPLEGWEARVAWRDRALIAQERGRRDFEPQEPVISNPISRSARPGL
jgi:L-gulonate 3-dehydrogenase